MGRIAEEDNSDESSPYAVVVVDIPTRRDLRNGIAGAVAAATRGI